MARRLANAVTPPDAPCNEPRPNGDPSYGHGLNDGERLNPVASKHEGAHRALADPFVGAFRLSMAVVVISAMWNGAGWGAIPVGFVLYCLLVRFLRR